MLKKGGKEVKVKYVEIREMEEDNEEDLGED